MNPSKAVDEVLVSQRWALVQTAGQEPAGSPSAVSRKGWENLGSSVVSRYSVGEEKLDTIGADVQLKVKEAFYHFCYNFVPPKVM